MKVDFVIQNPKRFTEKNAHFYECQRKNCPFVFVSPTHKHAWVELDMWTVDRNLDDRARDEIFETMIQFGVPPREAHCDHIICRADKVPMAVAKTLATHIYQIANNAIPRLLRIGKHA